MLRVYNKKTEINYFRISYLINPARFNKASGFGA